MPPEDGWCCQEDSEARRWQRRKPEARVCVDRSWFVACVLCSVHVDWGFQWLLAQLARVGKAFVTPAGHLSSPRAICDI